MKRISLLLILLLFVGASAFSQKKSGTLYSEHDIIDLTRNMWQSWASGDEEQYKSFFADSVWVSNNGEEGKLEASTDVVKSVAKFVGQYDKLKVMDHEPATPDVLEYKEGALWAMDWIKITGIHKESGIVLDLPVHNLYSFNKEGKVAMMVSYFDNDIFEEISNSKTKKKNGVVYINHPYISTVRKSMNALVAKDMETWKSFYSPDARYRNSTMEVGKTLSLEELEKALSEFFLRDDTHFKVKQDGYPDCVYYDKNDSYVVYSWWIMMVKKGDKKISYPFMRSDYFDKDGKIIYELVYFSSNHLEGLK